MGCYILEVLHAVAEITYATQVAYDLTYDEAYVRAQKNPGRGPTKCHKDKVCVHSKLVLRG